MRYLPLLSSVLLFSVSTAFAAADVESQPAGHANIHNPEAFSASLTQHAGKAIYDKYCVLCHAEKPTVALGAPRFRVENDWTIRVKKGVDGLIKTVEGGMKNMPARGGCFECTDDQLRQSVLYMLPKKYSKTNK